MILATEVIVAAISSVGAVGAGVIAMVNRRFRMVDTQLHELALENIKKTTVPDVKEIVSDKLAPIHVLLREIRDDIKDLKKVK